MRGRPGERQCRTGSNLSWFLSRSATFARYSGLYFGKFRGGRAGGGVPLLAAGGADSQPETQTEPPARCSGFTKSIPEPLSQVPFRSGCPAASRGSDGVCANSSAAPRVSTAARPTVTETFMRHLPCMRWPLLVRGELVVVPVGIGDIDEVAEVRRTVPRQIGLNVGQLAVAQQ